MCVRSGERLAAGEGLQFSLFCKWSSNGSSQFLRIRLLAGFDTKGYHAGRHYYSMHEVLNRPVAIFIESLHALACSILSWLVQGGLPMGLQRSEGRSNP
jgi:hypothetical protein